MGDLVRLALPLHRHQAAQPLDPVGLAARRMDLGGDDAGAHRIDADALLGHLAGKAHGETVDRAFRGGVVDILARRPMHRRHRRDIDDSAAPAAVARRHAAYRLPGAEERADDVGAENPFEAVRPHFVDARLAVDDAGVVDQGVERAEGHVDGLEHAQDVGFDADVALDADGLAAGFHDRAHKCGRRRLVQCVVHRDAPTAPRRDPSDGGADAAAAAGDEERPAAHSWHPLSLKTSHGTLAKPEAPYAAECLSDGPRSGKISFRGAPAASAGSSSMLPRSSDV